MAKATRNVETVTTFRGVTLELTPDEAAVLYELVGSITGNGYVRDRTTSVFCALRDVFGPKTASAWTAMFPVGGVDGDKFEKSLASVK